MGNKTMLYEMQIWEEADGAHGRVQFGDFETTASAPEPLMVLDLLWDALNEELGEQWHEANPAAFVAA